MRRILLFIIASSPLLFSCIKEPEINLETEEVFSPMDFDYTMTHELDLDLELKGPDNNSLAGTKIEIRSTSENKVMLTAYTDANGSYRGNIIKANVNEELELFIHALGIPNSWKIPAEENMAQLRISGTEVQTNLSESTASSAKSSARQSASTGPTIVYSAGYNNQGVPNNLLPRDVISSQLLQYVNASLPESQPVPQYHPTYLADGKKTNIDIIQTADVWLTFVHEGAGWRNAIAYYVYPTNQEPATLADIDSIFVLFPNLSFSGSGGGLQSGDKVLIGQFNPGQSIGLVLLANGWDGTNSEDYNHMVFSNKVLNPEPDQLLRQHNVLLYDDINEQFLVGFEDVRRDNIPFWCDQDFNDAILYFTSNPVTAISTDNVNPIDRPGTLDSDGDGINDTFDEYPNDPELAYTSYYPSATSYGTLAFEDNWPNMGDYDFNDAVIDYRFISKMNANNETLEMECQFMVRALGAGFRNGFGFSMDINPALVESVSGSRLFENYVNLSANGTENAQSKAVFIATDNLHSLFQASGFINTENTAVSHQAEEIILDIKFAQAQSSLGFAPFNPFLIISGNRGREVHLPSYEPTDLADQSLFGTGADDSNGPGTYYKSNTSHPWGFNFPESFDYPAENQSIINAHLKFNDWVMSGGFSSMDWYRDRNQYRNYSLIYLKP